ncbi:MAG TPA: pilus assembly protein TadG-related protein [Acidimicrobiia bacterium]|nr:pilus assembly protein TadG-related protein [Acidimicrobiia bacterium]
MNSERGSAPIWFLGLAVCVLMVGALSAELWRIIGERQELVAVADAAAIAGAAAIDLEQYRATGEAVIEPGDARARALAVIAGAAEGADLAGAPIIMVDENGAWIRVELLRAVPFGLLRILALDDEVFMVTGQAVAYPDSP